MSTRPISTEEKGEMNILKIKDTAGGVHPDILPNIFEAYFSTKKNGSGIGLAFCKKAVERFGGTLNCHSIYGESMEFILSFPKVIR